MSAIRLSIIITVVGGPAALRRCLKALVAQADPAETEIIVPYDQWAIEAGDLAVEFPQIRFHFYDDLGVASSSSIPAHAHRLYDRRRAVGLSLARGRIIAMTEDHAVPADDWVRQVHAAHAQPHAAIGGAIDNGVDRPLNRALYYCDFGRYGSPLTSGEAEYVSDVNVSYKREALMAVRDVWREAYHETTVHWALRSLGEVLYLDPRLVVHQHRPAITWLQAYRERFEWGRVFAETRVAAVGFGRRLFYAVGAPALPVVLLSRVWKQMRRQRLAPRQIIQTAPVAGVLLTGWALGELIGYIAGPPRETPDPPQGESRVTPVESKKVAL
ncbi:MAG: glycosyltransferase family 2 protein [Blastocatellales bacterium]